MRPLTGYHRSKTHPALLEARLDAERLNVADKVYFAFRAQFDSAKRREIDFQLSLEDWWHWWQTYDEQRGCVRWERRGIGRDALVMARFGDVGPYALDNIYCATHSQNFTDVDRRVRSEVMKVWHAENGCYLNGKRGDAHPQSKAIITPAGRFGSGALAAEYHGVSRQAAKYRADRKLYGWRWE